MPIDDIINGMNIYEELLTVLKAGRKAVVLTTLKDTGESYPEKILYTEADIDGENSVDEWIKNSLQTGELQIAGLPAERLILEPFFPEPVLLILGGGHIAMPLCELGSKLGFSVTVVDDRPYFANKERFPGADRVVCESFEKCFDSLQFHPYTYVIIVTRGHRYDLVCLRAIVNKTWRYAGMIGSKRRVREIMKQLLAEGVSSEIIGRINSPIGLEIGAVTPEEIAISILAQIIAYLRLNEPQLGNQSTKLSTTEFDKEVLEELAFGSNDEKALATIISTKGSVPRKAGAKMIVWPDGRILGSVGGGCSEAEVIHTALDVIRTGTYQIQSVDLTGSVAEDEGMVCGGTMEVLIEPV